MSYQTRARGITEQHSKPIQFKKKLCQTLSMTLSEYDRLKQQIVVGVGGSEKHGELVTMIKRLFKDEINSPRRYEQIKTIGELLEILEIRNELSENKVNLLEYIVRRLPNNEELSKKIQDFKAAHPVSPDYINRYASQSRPAPSYAGTHTNFMTSYLASTSMSHRKADRIHMTLVEQIGTHWRDLGRNLGIAQGKIDNIDASNETLKSKACTLLQQYEKIADPQRWFFHLCEALEHTRRRDLSRKIQEIMTMAL